MKHIYTLLIIIGVLLTYNAQAEDTSSVRIDPSKLDRGMLVIIQINDLPVFIMNRRLDEIDTLRKSHSKKKGQVVDCSDCDPVLRSISPDYLVIWGRHPVSKCELTYVSSTANDSVGHKVNGIGGFIDKCSGSEYDLTGRILSGPSVLTELLVPLHTYHDGILKIKKEQYVGDMIYGSDDCDYVTRLARNNDYESAIQMANKCIANNDTDAKSRINGYRSLAWGYFGLSDFSNAAKFQRKVLSLGGCTYNDYINAGLFFRLVGKLDESLEALMLAVKHDKKENSINMPTQYHLGWTYYELKNYENAIKAFTKGIPSQPDFAFIYYRRGLVYHSLGRKEEAKSDFIKFNELLTPEVIRSQIVAQWVKDELIEKQDLLANYGIILSLENLE